MLLKDRYGLGSFFDLELALPAFYFPGLPCWVIKFTLNQEMAICQVPLSEFSPITSPCQRPLPSTLGEKREGQSLPDPFNHHRSSPHTPQTDDVAYH